MSLIFSSVAEESAEVIWVDLRTDLDNSFEYILGASSNEILDIRRTFSVELYILNGQIFCSRAWILNSRLSFEISWMTFAHEFIYDDAFVEVQALRQMRAQRLIFTPEGV